MVLSPTTIKARTSRFAHVVFRKRFTVFYVPFVGQSAVGEFFVHQCLGNDADHSAARGERPVGDRAHQTYAAAAVN